MDEWVTRPVRGQNMPRYIIWHIPRTQDSHIHTWIRGVPEIAHGDRWAHWQQVRPMGAGIGITLAEADDLAQYVHKIDVLKYADEVHQAILSWLDEINEKDLEATPRYTDRLVDFPEYRTPGYYKETIDLVDMPVWGQLMRPCIGHVHRHLGELELLKNILRAGK